MIFVGEQNIPFRGHRDDSQHLDTVTNAGNFQALLDFREESGDKVLEEHFKTTPRTATYGSKTIQNQLISCCDDHIRNVII